jgi:hypothetical protein
MKFLLFSLIYYKISIFRQESITALQALTEYAFRARLLDITDMSVTLEMPSANGLRHELQVMGNDTEASHFAADVSVIMLPIYLYSKFRYTFPMLD